MRPVRAAHRELALSMTVKNITWACASRSGDALIDAACCTRGRLCFGARGTAEHPCGSCMETKQLAPVSGQGGDAVADATLPGFPSRAACKSCFCDEAKKKQLHHYGSRGSWHDCWLAGGTAQRKPPGCGSGWTPIFWLVLLLFSQPSYWCPNTSVVAAAATAVPWSKADRPLPTARTQWSRCAQMLGMLGDSWCSGGSQGETRTWELHRTPPWVMHCRNLSHPCSHQGWERL